MKKCNYLNKNINKFLHILYLIHFNFGFFFFHFSLLIYFIEFKKKTS